MTQAAYCRAHGVNAKYLSLWKRKLRDESTPRHDSDTATAGLTLVPVKINTSCASAVSQREQPAVFSAVAAVVPIRVTLSNGVIVTMELPDVHHLRPVLNELAGLSC